MELKCISICIIIYCILNIKKKNYLWNLLISIGLLPFFALILISIYATFHGTGLVGDNGGIGSGLFSIVATLIVLWPVYIGAIVLLIFLIKKRKKDTNEKNKLSIIEKALMISLIVTNIVFIINLLFVDITYRPLFLYRLFNISDNIYYGIGVTVEKISETGISYHVDFISLIVFLCIIFAIGFIFLKIKETRTNN